MNLKPVGKCGSCGGVVSIPVIWHGVNRPAQTCELCGMEADTSVHLPTLLMKPGKRNSEIDKLFSVPHFNRGEGWGSL